MSISDLLKNHVYRTAAGEQLADGWKVDEDQLETYVHRFENLTVLGQEYNRSAVNEDFESKKNYQESVITMIQDLVNYDGWGVEAIEESQERLADVAIQIWTKA